jgi:hypothetical protein
MAFIDVQRRPERGTGTGALIKNRSRPGFTLWPCAAVVATAITGRVTHIAETLATHATAITAAMIGRPLPAFLFCLLPSDFCLSTFGGPVARSIATAVRSRDRV